MTKSVYSSSNSFPVLIAEDVSANLALLILKFSSKYFLTSSFSFLSSAFNCSLVGWSSMSKPEIESL
nr:hypothetical protein [Mycoplasmopsis agalactiae]